MPKARHTVLLVDDDAAVARVLSALLEQAGLGTIEARGGEQALALLASRSIDLVLSDVRMPGIGGMELLQRINRGWPDIPVILLTAHGSVSLAVEAMKAGAADFMLKPFDREEVVFVIQKALLGAERGEAPPERAPSGARFLRADSPRMRELEDRIRRAASSTATVLVRGETGTGKELVARAIHEQSPRRAGPFVKLNCAALPESLLESELFGYEKGAFTGASNRKPGRVELAHGGTLFLDEIGDVPLSTQVKLLRILQEREIERVGGTQTIQVDVRFVAATHRDLEELIDEGQFREDLFYRLNVVPIEVPPLRDRAEDIAHLASHFARGASSANGKAERRFGAAALDALGRYPWPGNVRQLENFVERLVVLGDAPEIGLEEVQRELSQASGRSGVHKSSEPLGPPESARPLEQKVRDTERQAVLQALARAGNNRSLAARILGISRRTLYNKLEEFGVPTS